MAGAELDEPVQHLLAREELLFLLGLLGAGSIPGLEDDPAGVLSAAESAISLRTAERGLRARRLVWRQPDQQLAVQRDLLAAVGACAYANTAILVYFWDVAQELPAPCLVHRHNGDLVMHTRPADVLHLLALLPSAAAAARRIVDFCRCAEVESQPFVTLRLSGAVFANARELAAAGAEQESAALLAAHGAPSAAAQALVSTLAGPARAANLQLLRQAGDRLDRRDYILLQADRRAWLVESAPEGAQEITVRSTGREEILALLAEWLTPQPVLPGARLALA